MNYEPLLLIIDDEEAILKNLKDALQDEQYRVETLSHGNKALDVIGKLVPDLVLLDIFMPNCNGLELLEKIKEEYPMQKVMLISGFGNIPIAIEAVKKGALDFIEKPLNLDEILLKIKFLRDKDSSDNPSKKDKADFELKDFESYGIVGKSYLFLELMQQVEHVAQLRFPLLIYGQHGTGKTLIAKYIHSKSEFDQSKFFVVNCSALDKKRSIEFIEKSFLNKSGTIFIKNIEFLSSDGQKRLLFKIEEMKDKKLRLIVTSSISLFNLVKRDSFNSALFHKLNLTPIEIPPLNKRRYDISLLVDSFLKKYNKKYGKSVLFNNKSLRMLTNYNWQGNVAQLKSVIEKIVKTVCIDDQIITTDALALYLNEKLSHILEEQAFLGFKSLREATCEFEKKFLLYLLKKNRYDINQVSNRLDLTTVQLRDKMLEFNIDMKI